MNCIKKSLTTSNRQDLKVHSRVHRCPAGPLQPAPDQGHHRQGRYGPLHLGEQKCALYAVIPDNDQTFNFLVSLLYSQAFQALYYSADQIYHGALPCHVHFVLDEFAAMRLPGFTRELATMRSRNISASTIIQNMAQIKELFKDSWETIPGNSDTILYLGGNESSTHKVRT